MASFDQGPYYGLVWSRTLLRPRLIKDSKNIKNPVVLSCFRSKIMKKHWFYCVFAQKVAFLVKILVPKCKKHKNVEKPLVLLCFRSKMLKNHWFYSVPYVNENFN